MRNTLPRRTSRRPSRPTGPGRHQGRADPRRRAPGADQVPRPHARHLHRPVGPGLQDPHTNAETFADERRQYGRREVEDAGLAQCLGHPGDDQGDGRRRDGARRQEARRDVSEMQREHQKRSPFIIMFQETEVAARGQERRRLRRSGPSFDNNFYAAIEEVLTPVNDRPGDRRGRARTLAPERGCPRCRFASCGRWRGSPASVAADLPRPAARHLPDRPRRADRPGAGRGGRPRAGRGLRAGRA